MAASRGRCDNCGEDFKESMFSSNFGLRQIDVDLINKVNDLQLPGACNKCGEELLGTSRRTLMSRLSTLKRELEVLLAQVPLASINQPFGWHYRTIGLVTAQTVTGTGLFSDVASAFTDLFGAQSGMYNQKLRAAEDLCRASLRAQTVQAGGDAVLGIDVDYAEVGGQRAMLMVCMTGTAVALANPEAITPTFNDEMAELAAKRASYAELSHMGRQHGLLS